MPVTTATICEIRNDITKEDEQNGRGKKKNEEGRTRCQLICSGNILRDVMRTALVGMAHLAYKTHLYHIPHLFSYAGRL